ncbi:MAG: hypothetical protein ACE5H7_15580 [Acidiferrobacterales bacterium]
MKRKETIDNKQHIFDKPKNVKRVMHALYAVCAVLFLVDFVYARKMVHPWEAVWGFYAVYGFVACVLLVLIAKEMRRLVMRREDYYDLDG